MVELNDERAASRRSMLLGSLSPLNDNLVRKASAVTT
jgi:hypothetical protein